MSIRITEYLYSGTNGEFAELTNVGLTPVDMTGWSFDDKERIPGATNLSAFGTVQPGESVLLIESADVTGFRTAWNLAATVKIIGGNLNNLGRNDEINVFDSSSNLIDRLTYDDEAFPGTIRAQNRSGWVDVDGLGLNDIAQWRLSTVGDAQNSIASTGNDIGSPGVAIFSDPPTGAVPTIQAAAATPFLNVPTTGSGVVSGVINDATDPARQFGIDFTIADEDTDISALTVTATSSNPAVVPTVNLTGSGASRNLKITPVGVGLTDITVTVSDGENTADYVIQYGASAAPTRPSTRFHTGASDASTAVAIDSTYMLVADDEDQTIRLYDRTQSGLPLAGFDFTGNLNLTDVSGSGRPREVDIEGSTRVGNRIYWIGSHSNSSGGSSRPNRYRVFTTDLAGSGAGASLNYVGHFENLRSQLISWGDANGYNFTASAATGVIPEAPTLDGFNIEGLTLAPDNTTGYVAFRAPNVPTANRTQALIAPISNFTEVATGAAAQANIGAPIELNLGGRGIRSIERNSNNEYLIVAGPSDQATGIAPKDFRLYTWTGIASDAPVLRGNNLTALNVNGSFESIVEIPASLKRGARVQLLVDNGDADFYGTGDEAKELTDNLQKFRSESITLGRAIITGTSGQDTLTGTSDDDRITGLADADRLAGGEGADLFVYNRFADRGDQITDFAVGEDQVVLTRLFQNLGLSLTYQEAISGGYLSFQRRQTIQGSDTILRIDRDGFAGRQSSTPLIEFRGVEMAAINNAANFVI
ncbi:MAG: DUF3616 domain-containing protein [Elainella sp. Prado103]|nr:DUF3616 domain-containing protein [Elainella sp. Prado103]